MSNYDRSPEDQDALIKLRYRQLLDENVNDPLFINALVEKLVEHEGLLSKFTAQSRAPRQNRPQQSTEIEPPVQQEIPQRKARYNALEVALGLNRR